MQITSKLTLKQKGHLRRRFLLQFISQFDLNSTFAKNQNQGSNVIKNQENFQYAFERQILWQSVNLCFADMAEMKSQHKREIAQLHTTINEQSDTIDTIVTTIVNQKKQIVNQKKQIESCKVETKELQRIVDKLVKHIDDTLT